MRRGGCESDRRSDTAERVGGAECTLDVEGRAFASGLRRLAARDSCRLAAQAGGMGSWDSTSAAGEAAALRRLGERDRLEPGCPPGPGMDSALMLTRARRSRLRPVAAAPAAAGETAVDSAVLAWARTRSGWPARGGGVAGRGPSAADNDDAAGAAAAGSGLEQ